MAYKIIIRQTGGEAGPLKGKGGERAANIVVWRLLQTGCGRFGCFLKLTNVRSHSLPSDSEGCELLPNV